MLFFGYLIQNTFKLKRKKWELSEKERKLEREYCTETELSERVSDRGEWGSFIWFKLKKLAELNLVKS